MAANLSIGSYAYLNNLLSLEATSGPATHFNRVVEFLPLHKWEPFPDQCFAAFMRRSISSGFRLGFNPASPLRASKSNSPSATSLSAKVDEYLRDEVEAGNLNRVAESPSIHISPIGFIPNINKPGRYRLIVNLSAPEGASVNNGISSVASSFHYITVRETARMIPQGAFLAKIDLKAAYRKVPVHPQDHYLLGISWKDQIFCNKVLPFGLRSAPIIGASLSEPH